MPLARSRPWSKGFAFDGQGNLFTATDYSTTTGTGTPLNQVERVYNGFGQMTIEYQEHTGAVNTSTSKKVQYAYIEGASGANNSRLTGITYPTSTYIVTYGYSSGLDSDISRLSFLSDGTNHLEEYTYLGLGTIVQKAHPQVSNTLTLSYINTPSGSTDGGDRYTGLDRFGRIIDQYWYTGTSTTTDRFQYAYDRTGDVLYKNIVGLGTTAATFSELYHTNSTGSGDNATAYDALGRLTNFRRGTLSVSAGNNNGASGLGSLDTVTTLNSASGSQKTWNLDLLGNPSGTSGVVTDTTNQNRVNNSRNQTTTVGANTITYDNDGSVKTDPVDLGGQYFYDAWGNRQVSSCTGSYGYDALGRRVQDTEADSYTSSTSYTKAHDLYYSANWQVLEDRATFCQTGCCTASTDVDQYVWGLGYVDDLVLRDRTPAVGSAIRLYVQQDANYNVTALVDTSGAVQDRFVYDPYGNATRLDPTAWTVTTAWTVATDTKAWRYYFQGGRYETSTGLYAFRNRDYSPLIGKWVEADPAWYVDGPSLYQFEVSDPSDGLDPNGTQVAVTIPEGTPFTGAGSASGSITGAGPGILGWEGTAGGYVELDRFLMNNVPAYHDAYDWSESTRIVKMEHKCDKYLGDLVDRIPMPDSNRIIWVDLGHAIDDFFNPPAPPPAVIIDNQYYRDLFNNLPWSVVNTGSSGLQLPSDFSVCKDKSKKPAPNVTAGGRQTDQHGNPLGPSGEPAIHIDRFPSRKRAKDAARNDGQQAPISNPSPTRGNRHFHSTDSGGNQKPNGIHYEY